MTYADPSPASRCDEVALPVALVRRGRATLACWRRRAVERRQLAELPPERWPDIARDPDAIRREIAKPFWRA